jgi:ankyrin repeat protein
MGSFSSKTDTVLRNNIEDGVVIYDSPAFVPKNGPKNSLNIVSNSNTPLTRLFEEKSKFDETTLETVKQYLIDGADPNLPAIDEGGKVLLSPLYLCCRNGFTPSAVMIAEILLQNGAEVEPHYTAVTNYSPLIIVLSKNKTKTAIDMVRLLLKYGADTKFVCANDTVFSVLERDQPEENKKIIREMILEHNAKLQQKVI